jgi:O-antigen/teichoic acid export membrane protein
VKFNRTGRSIKNFATGILGYSVTLSVSVFSTPLLITWLGDERYGAFRTASNWVSYIGLLELGIGRSLLPLLAKSLGKDDKELTRLTLITGIKVYLQILAIMLVVGIGLGWFIPDLVHVHNALKSELQIGYWLGLTGLFFVLITPFRMLADASQRSYLIHAWLTVQVIAMTGLSLLFAWAGMGIPGQYLAVILGSIPYQFLIYWDGIRSYPNLFATVVKPQAIADIKKQIWQLNWPIFGLNLSGQLNLFTDNIIISYILGPAIVVPFFVTQRLAALAQSQIQGVSNATWAALAELYAQGEMKRFNARLIELTRLVAVIGLALMIAIAAYNPYFVSLWVGQDRFGGNILSLLTACNGFLLGLLTLWRWCFGGTGMQAKILAAAIVETGINVSVSIISTYRFGIIGPVLGTFVGIVTFSFWCFPVLLRNVFGTSLKQLFFAVAKPLAVGIPYGLIVWYIARSHTPWGWLGLAAEMAVSAILYLVIAWLLVLNQTERSQWNNRLRMLFSTIHLRFG